VRDHDVTTLTGRELEQARRELAASLALARPGPPARVPILAQMKAIDAELAARSGRRPGELPSSHPHRPRTTAALLAVPRTDHVVWHYPARA
jgi:hypothetical protein